MSAPSAKKRTIALDGNKEKVSNVAYGPKRRGGCRTEDSNQNDAQGVKFQKLA